jgi:hypothetical protein
MHKKASIAELVPYLGRRLREVFLAFEAEHEMSSRLVEAANPRIAQIKLDGLLHMGN